MKKSALTLSGPEGAKLHVARRRVESELNKVVISKTKILRLRRWKVINFLAEFYYYYGRVYLKQPSYREGLIAWDFSKCAKKFALNHITINDNGGFNRHRHVGEEGETKGEAGSEQTEKDFPERIWSFSSLFFCSTHGSMASRASITTSQ